jgi:uncharacterized protein (TIGR03083 family)
VTDNGMQPGEHLRWLAAERAAFGRMLEDGDLTAPVPSCPDWRLRELAAHLGGVHRWARLAVLAGPASDQDPTPRARAALAEHPVPSERAALVGWFDDGGAELERTLRETDPGTPCWTIAPPAVAAFWMRRQAHETAMHRWDAQRSCGTPEPIDPALAADGVAEVAEMVFPRQVRLGRQSPLAHGLRVEIAGGPAYTLAGDGTAPGPADATVTGPPEALLLLLWRRTTLDDPRVRLTGSRDAAVEVLGAHITP